MSLVSVIVPAYNYAHFLGETLASVRAQTHDDWECIVVDDGSTDDTWDVAQTHARQDRRIRYLRRRNGGLAAARNSGLAEARGEFVQLLDADDAIEPRKLEAQAAYLGDHDDIGIVYGDVRYFDSDTGERHRGLFDDTEWMPRISGPGSCVLKPLMRANIMVVNAPLVRRSVIERVGPFDEARSSLEDWEYWIRCAAAGTYFRYLASEGTLSLVRVHRRSMSQDRVRMLEQQVAIRRRLTAALIGDEAFAQNRFWLCEELGILGSELSARGDHLGAARRWVAARAAHPNGAKWLKRAMRTLLRRRA